MSKNNQDVVLTDDVLKFASQRLASAGRLPGRVAIQNEFDLSPNVARRMAALLQARLAVDTGKGYSVAPDAEPTDEEDVWAKQIEASRRALHARQQTQYRELHFPEPGGPIIVCFPSDMHLGHPLTDHARILEDQKLVAATPRCYQVFAGDLFDNAIKHRAHKFDSGSTPAKEVQLLEQILPVAGHRILGVISGNHDHWTFAYAGVDVLKMLLNRSGVIYSPHRLYLTIYVGGQEYTLYVTHQYRYESAMNPAHGVQRLLERGQDDFDVGVIGHTHQAFAGMFVWRREWRVAIRPGSYQVSSDYGDMRGFNDSMPTLPVVVLHPGRRQIDAYADLRLALNGNATLRGETP